MQRLKLLPWLARQRGIALERAEELWRQAMALADVQHRGGEPTSDDWGYAMRTLLKLMRVEGPAMLEPAQVFDPDPPRRPPVAQLLASQHCLGAAAFDAAEAYARAANELWRQTWRARRVR